MSQKPKAWRDEDFFLPASDRVTLTVVEDDAQWSGLLDARGNKLMQPKQPLGFNTKKR